MMRDGLSDLNDGTIDGVYYCSSGNETNAPITGRRLIVNVTSFNSRISQMAISEKGESYSRFCINQVWSAWQRLDNFGYNSLAELAGGVADVIKPIMPLGSITGNIDEIVDCGAYMCEPSLTTSSFELPFEGDFSLYTFASSNLAYFKFQIAVDMSQNNSLNVKFRRFRSSWTQWQSVSFV